MARFHRLEAQELQRRVFEKVKRDMAFQMVSFYKNAVLWCLLTADSANAMERQLRPALEFHDRVVVPLEKLARR